MTASTHPTTRACRHVERIQLGNCLLRRHEVELKTGKSRSSIYKGVSESTFLRPYRLATTVPPGWKKKPTSR